MRQKQIVKLVITDLDDTIWNWLHMWYSSFYNYLHRISTEFNIDENSLINDFKQLHQKYNSSEASYIYNELSVLSLENKKNISVCRTNKDSKSIIHEYYSTKKSQLYLYDGAKEFLELMKELGIIVVGFTESNSFFSKYRIKHLELDGLFDTIYAPKDFKLPDSVERIYEEGHWNTKITKFKELPEKTMKPNPDVLNKIIADYSIDKQNVIYVGDKLDRDICMANQANVTSVYAEYGHVIDGKQYELLKKVSHWSLEDIEREKTIKKSSNIVKPDYTITQSLCEMKDFFIFRK